LRTVIWDFAGQAIPEPLLGALKALAAALAPEQPFYLEIADYLSDAEISGIGKRCAKLLADERFPFPDENRRATPWPPV